MTLERKRQTPRLGPVSRESRRRAVEPLDVDLASAAPVREVPLHLGLDHVARGWAGVVWAEDRRNVVGQLEALEQRGEPAIVGRRRVLGQERDVARLGELHHQVPRPAVRELALRDLVDRARRAVERSRASRRSSPSRRPAARPRDRRAALGRRQAPRRGSAAPFSTGIATVTTAASGAGAAREEAACSPRQLTHEPFRRAQRRGQLPRGELDELLVQRAVVLGSRALGLPPMQLLPQRLRSASASSSAASASAPAARGRLAPSPPPPRAPPRCPVSARRKTQTPLDHGQKEERQRDEQSHGTADRLGGRGRRGVDEPVSSPAGSPPRAD